MQDYGNPFLSRAMPCLEYTTGRIKKHEALSGAILKPRLPITINVLKLNLAELAVKPTTQTAPFYGLQFALFFRVSAGA